MVEFVIVAMTLLFILLGTLQLALLLNAQMLVRYAAFNAARTAIVTGGDRLKMLDAARMSLLPVFPNHGRALTPLGWEENYLGALRVDQQTNWLGANGVAITSVSIENVKKGEVITFDDPGSGTVKPITVQVTHQYELVIPIVNAAIVKARELFAAGKSPGTPDELVKRSAESARRLKAKPLWSGYRVPLTATYTMHPQSDIQG